MGLSLILQSAGNFIADEPLQARSLFLWGVEMGRKKQCIKPDTPDPIEAEANVSGEKYCTSCGIRQSLAEFHRDETKEDGHRDTCRGCRAKINKEKKERNLAAELRKIEEQGIKTLGTLTDGGSYDPHINEVFESMMKPFGGVQGWAKHLFATYLACDPGSQKRVKIHDMMMQLAGKVTKLGLAERQLDMMEEKDLLQVMRGHIVDFQKGNDLASTMIPTLGDSIIDAETVEAEDE